MAQRGRGTLEVNPSKSPFFQTTTQTIGVDPYSKAEWNHHQITQQQLQQQLTRYNNANKRSKDPEIIDSKMFDFLYSRESDRIGAKPDTLNSLKHQMEADTKQLNQKSGIQQQHHNNHDQHQHAHFAPQQQQINRNQREEQQHEQEDERFIQQQQQQDEEEEEEENRIRYEQDMMMEQQQQGSQYQSTTSRHPTAEEILAQYKHQPKAEHPRYLTSGNEYGRKPPTMATVVVERVPKKQDFSRSFGTMKPRNSSMNTAISKSTIHSSLDLQFL